MNLLRSKTTVRNSSKEESNYSKNFRNHPVLTHTVKDKDLQNIFYSCTTCQGPLIPVSNCIFCKRSTMRKCTDCGALKKFSSHDSCKTLLSFGKIIALKYSSID